MRWALGSEYLRTPENTCRISRSPLPSGDAEKGRTLFRAVSWITLSESVGQWVKRGPPRAGGATVTLITRKNVLRVLIFGFSLVILLLVAAGIIGVNSIRSIQAGAASLAEEQLLTNRLIDEIQREQATLSAVFHTLARDIESIDRQRILAQLDEADRNIKRGLGKEGTKLDEALWRDFQSASSGFSAEARRLISQGSTETLASGDLFRRHEQVMSIVRKLVAVAYEKSIAAHQQIDRQSTRLVRNSVALLGACLLLALVCAVLTVRLATDLFRKMEHQASELSRVSWHMLETQETAARRFSHELHDELGQSLSAIKATLMALPYAENLDEQRLEDCVALVDDAIRNVRELSQLLRPTILDDLGLDAALRSLCEGFASRTGIAVDYVSEFSGRLPEETETHLFRIAQETFTNAARHSGANRVRMELRVEGKEVRLLVADNGQGIREEAVVERRGLGLIGMRARARCAGGELTLRSDPGRGVRIEARVPVPVDVHEKKDTHLVG